MPHCETRYLEIPTARPTRARSIRGLCAAITTAILIALPAFAQFQLDGAVLTGGGGHSESTGHCFRLDATLGEPSAGSSSGGAFALTAGHAARFDPGTRDLLFDTGFEACQ